MCVECVRPAAASGVQFEMIDAAAKGEGHRRPPRLSPPTKVLVFPHSRHAIKNFSSHVSAGDVSRPQSQDPGVAWSFVRLKGFFVLFSVKWESDVSRACSGS